MRIGRLWVPGCFAVRTWTAVSFAMNASWIGTPRERADPPTHKSTPKCDLAGSENAWICPDDRAAERLDPRAFLDDCGHARTGDRRRGRDSNPRCPCGHNGFRDRPIQPL